MTDSVELRYLDQTKLVPREHMFSAHCSVLSFVRHHYPHFRGRTFDIKLNLEEHRDIFSDANVWQEFIFFGARTGVNVFTVEPEPENSHTIYIQTPTDRTLSVLVDLWRDSAEILKLRIREEVRLPQHNQAFFLNGQELPDSRWKSLASVGVVPNATLQLIARDPGAPLLVIRDLKGNAFPYYGELSDTIDGVKSQLEFDEGISVDSQRLIYNQKELGWNSLYAYRVPRGAVLHLVYRLTGGKPVIYLRSPVEVDATVEIALAPEWSFSALCPVVQTKDGQSAVWNVQTKTDGTMLDKNSGADVGYLFWEAITNPWMGSELTPPPSPILGTPSTFHPSSPHTFLTRSTSVALTKTQTPAYLDAALKSLGLGTEARTSFITYWITSLLNHPAVLITFLPQSAYAATAPLTIHPTPDVVTHVFMLFRGLEAREWRSGLWATREERGAKMWRDVVGAPSQQKQEDKSLFRVLEWGGMEVKV